MKNSEPTGRPIWLTVKDACRLGGFRVTTCYKLLKQGLLESVKIGGKRLISYQSLVRLGSEAGGQAQ